MEVYLQGKADKHARQNNIPLSYANETPLIHPE